MTQTTTATSANNGLSSHAAAMGAAALEHCPLRPTYGPPPVQFVRGSGCELYDRDGKRYLDFLAGLAVTSLGHSHPAVADALNEQARTLLHVSNLFGTEPQVEVAQTIDRLQGGGGQVFFCNSGAESLEGAIKLARKYGGPWSLRGGQRTAVVPWAHSGDPARHRPAREARDVSAAARRIPSRALQRRSGARGRARPELLRGAARGRPGRGRRQRRRRRVPASRPRDLRRARHGTHHR